MKTIFSCVSIFLVCVLSGCDSKTGNGNIISKTIPSGTFEAIEISGPFEVEIKNGNVQDVVFEGDENLLRYADVAIRNNKLVARLKGSIHNSHLKIYVTTASLNSIKGAAGADIEIVSTLSAKEKMVIDLSSSASIKGNLDAPEIELEASSSADMVLSGRTKILNAKASSSATINASKLLSEKVEADATSSADISLHASVELDASASSSGEINYRGGAIVKEHTSSSGSIHKID